LFFYILDELKDKDAFNPIIKDKVGFLPITNKVYIKGGN